MFRIPKRNMLRRDGAWKRRLLADLLPGAGKRARGKDREAMIRRLDNVLCSIPDFGQYRALVHRYSGEWPGPRARRTDDMPGCLGDDPDCLAGLAFAFLKESPRREYVRTGSNDYLETYFSCPAILLLHDWCVYVPADLDRFDPDTFLAGHADIPTHIREELEKFWVNQHRLKSKQRPVTGLDLDHAASEARLRLGRDLTFLAATEDMANAVRLLTGIQSGKYPKHEADDRLAEAQALATSADMILGARSPRSDRAAYHHLNGWKRVPPRHDKEGTA